MLLRGEVPTKLPHSLISIWYHIALMSARHIFKKLHFVCPPMHDISTAFATISANLTEVSRIASFPEWKTAVYSAIVPPHDALLYQVLSQFKENSASHYRAVPVEYLAP